MKHQLLLFLLLLSLTTVAQQSFGISGGVNRSWQMRQQLYPSQTSKERTASFTGWQAGGWWQMQCDKKFSIRTGLNYLMLNSEFTALMEDMILAGITEPQPFRHRMGWLDVPVLAQWHAGRVVVGAGPGVALQLWGRMEPLAAGRDHGSFKYSQPNFSANAMLGLRLHKSLGVDFRYLHGLNNLYGKTSSARASNRSAQASLTYQIFQQGK